ncbi:unnamed protein product [Gemmataceae bacterium]|nr:unnamed protein product [Gemmataceae bacterium]VTU01012.1 unnamed protein product [Gemmataceae bacterium]
MSYATDEAGFLADICANPDDDTPRLVYADWLQERDREARAEFIRVQCGIARKVAAEPKGKDPMWITGFRIGLHGEESFLNLFLGRGQKCECVNCLQKRERELLDGFNSDKLDCFVREFPDFRLVGLTTTWYRGENPLGDVRRGFVEHAMVPADVWFDHAGGMLSRNPIREVKLTTKPTAANHSRMFRERFGLGAALPLDVEFADTNEEHLKLLKGWWPKVAFTLPPEPV